MVSPEKNGENKEKRNAESTRDVTVEKRQLSLGKKDVGVLGEENRSSSVAGQD